MLVLQIEYVQNKNMMVFFSTTHLKDSDIEIEGHEQILINRPTVKVYTNLCDRGGIVLFRQNLNHGITKESAYGSS